jgi:hypothetical protein
MRQLDAPVMKKRSSRSGKRHGEPANARLRT